MYSTIASKLIRKVKFAQLLQERIDRDQARLTILGREIFGAYGLADQLNQFKVERDREAKRLMLDRLENREEVPA